jgi:hypothetical protein
MKSSGNMLPLLGKMTHFKSLQPATPHTWPPAFPFVRLESKDYKMFVQVEIGKCRLESWEWMMQPRNPVCSASGPANQRAVASRQSQFPKRKKLKNTRTMCESKLTRSALHNNWSEMDLPILRVARSKSKDRTPGSLAIPRITEADDENSPAFYTELSVVWVTMIQMSWELRSGGRKHREVALMSEVCI